jgi:hypothetical protein
MLAQIHMGAKLASTASIHLHNDLADVLLPAAHGCVYVLAMMLAGLVMHHLGSAFAVAIFPKALLAPKSNTKAKATETSVHKG